MSENTTSSTGETARNFLEKITPKDLVMFSPATRKVIAKVFVLNSQDFVWILN